MKTTLNSSEKFLSIAVIFSLLITTSRLYANDELLPDQNPNYKNSQDKYMVIKDDYLKKENTTVQQTYKAIDDVQAKKDRKALKKERRHERKMERITNRHSRRAGRYYSPYYGYNNYNYSFPYYTNHRRSNNRYGYGYNYNVGYTPYNCGYYSNRGYYNSSFNYGRGAHMATNAALLGLGMYLLLR